MFLLFCIRIKLNSDPQHEIISDRQSYPANGQVVEENIGVHHHNELAIAAVDHIVVAQIRGVADGLR